MLLHGPMLQLTQMHDHFAILFNVLWIVSYCTSRLQIKLMVSKATMMIFSLCSFSNVCDRLNGFGIMTIINCLWIVTNAAIWIYLVLKFSFSGTLEPTYRQLQTMKLDKSPFVIISVIGQELLAQTKYNAAVQVLQSALKIGTCSLKLRGSVFSALSSAYWALNSLDKVKNI